MVLCRNNQLANIIFHSEPEEWKETFFLFLFTENQHIANIQSVSPPFYWGSLRGSPSPVFNNNKTSFVWKVSAVVLCFLTISQYRHHFLCPETPASNPIKPHRRLRPRPFPSFASEIPNCIANCPNANLMIGLRYQTRRHRPNIPL